VRKSTHDSPFICLILEAVRKFFSAAPGGVPTQVAFSQSRRYKALDDDRDTGIVRNAEHAFSKDGGLAVSDEILAERRAVREVEGWVPSKPRKRKITTALRAYAALTSSAAKGAVRVV
jgi:dihydroxyacid dehydratase/phosphogluconate dehydratase